MPSRTLWDHEPPGDGHAGPGEKLRVLLADDEAMIRSLLRRVLELRGHQVVEAEDAPTARALLEEGSFQAALVDANMPGGGVGLLGQICGGDRFRGVAILMTGDLVSEVEGLPPEVHRIQKPFDLQALVRLVESGRGADAD